MTYQVDHLFTAFGRVFRHAAGLILCGLFVVVLCACSRLPVDDVLDDMDRQLDVLSSAIKVRDMEAIDQSILAFARLQEKVALFETGVDAEHSRRAAGIIEHAGNLIVEATTLTSAYRHQEQLTLTAFVL